MSNNTPFSLPKAMLVLGYAGLIPFIALPLLQFSLGAQDSTLQSTLNAYAFGIISFLCGTWWRSQRQQQADSPVHGAKDSALVLSNVLFLVAFFSFVFLVPIWPIIAATLFLMLFAIEHYTPFVGQFALGYKRFRRVLSTIAAIGMLSSFLLNGG